VGSSSMARIPVTRWIENAACDGCVKRAVTCITDKILPMCSREILWERKVTSQQDDLMRRAVECDRLMNLEADPTIQGVLRLIGEMWVASANESASMCAEGLARQIAAIDKIQSQFRPPKTTAH
jgi:hypothetical protein